MRAGFAAGLDADLGAPGELVFSGRAIGTAAALVRRSGRVVGAEGPCGLVLVFTTPSGAVAADALPVRSVNVISARLGPFPGDARC